MQVFILFSIAVAIFAIVFALQNGGQTTVTFLGWSFEGSLALVILISVASGVVISSLASLPPLFKSRWGERSLRKKVVDLEARLAEQGRRLEESERKKAEQQEVRKDAPPPSLGTNNPVI